jgi:ribonuclease P protein component
VGFLVPKYGHNAVERNRLKRRLREIVRTRLLGTLVPVDAVVKAHRNAYSASFETLVGELKDGFTTVEQ